MNESNVNAVRSALLYMAALYHQIAFRADKFDDGAISDAAITAERTAQRLSVSVANEGIVTAADAQTVLVALSALVDSMNVELQKMHTRGQIQDAALVEHRIREVYEAIAAVGLLARGLAPAEVATA